MEPALARKMWRTLEPYHGMIYFVPEAGEEYERLGISGRMPGYFASRSAPMGEVSAGVVIATFFNFHPALVRTAVPAVWSAAPAADIVAARLRAVDASLRRVFGPKVDSVEVGEAAGLARAAALACSPPGRPLYAGHASLPWRAEPHVILWHAITLLREFRGDGHIAALVTEEVGGGEALVIHGATGDVAPTILQSSRQWPDADCAACVESVRARGWLDEEGTLTQAGRDHRARVESMTDRLALAPWQELGVAGCERLRELVRPLSKEISENVFAPPRR